MIIRECGLKIKTQKRYAHACKSAAGTKFVRDCVKQAWQSDVKKLYDREVNTADESR